MISLTPGYQNPGHFGDFGDDGDAAAQPTSSTAALAPSMNATAGQSAGQTTVPTYTVTGQTVLPVAQAPAAPPNALLWNPQNPGPAVQKAVVYLGVPVLAYAFLTRSGLSRWLLAGLGAGLVYLHMNGTLAAED